MKDNIPKTIIMFLTGAITYFYFEIFMRGYSHISMFILGGLCFCLVGNIGLLMMRINWSLVVRLIMIMLMSSCVITFLELITGIIVNIRLDLSVWDYSQLKYNYRGQICLLYSAIWSILGLPCVFYYGIIEKFVIGSGRKEKTKAKQ
ncbi:MAG: hypothetical protein E7263_08315 [Lachnospiraceae bacterium]|nr:hypothetical protein [Lachnospiraceae bacterium]